MILVTDYFSSRLRQGSVLFALLVMCGLCVSAVRAAEAFSLIGTAAYPDGSFAIFDGTDSTLRDIVHPGEKIGDYTLSRVMTDRVVLTGRKGEVELRMDQQLRRDETGQWQMLVLNERLSPRELSPRPESSQPSLPSVVAAAPVRQVPSVAPDGGGSKIEKEFQKLDKKLSESGKSEKDLRKIESDGGKKLLKSLSKEFRKKS